MSKIEYIKELLEGHFYTEVRLDCAWAIRFDNQVWLLAQSLQFPEESGINENLEKNMPSVLPEIDSEDSARMLLLLKTRQSKLSEVSLLEHEELLLKFENGNQIKVKTDADIVDWQWSLSEQDTDPYQSTLAACYYPGSIEVPSKC